MSRILLVEDNPMNLDMLTRRLMRKGYDVLTATDGVQGVALAEAEQPDIILMDISLPILDGWEATRQIRANPTTTHIPIIAVTANALAGDREKSLAAGCQEFESKPIDFPRLLGKIEHLLKHGTEL